MRRRISGWAGIGAAAVLVSAATPGGVPGPVNDAMFRATDPAQVAVGRLLVLGSDPVGQPRTSRAAPATIRGSAPSDGVSLDLGEGGIGLGPDRVADPADLPEERVPRNAPALFNLGATEFTVLFDDGRVEADPRRRAGFRTPLEDDMVARFRLASCRRRRCSR